MDKELLEAAEIICNAQYTIALVGAGISAESGIPTFRGPGGLWTKYGEPDMRGYQRFLADPEGWWRNRLSATSGLGELAAALQTARPNPAHYALSDLEQMNYLRHIITQNVDNLHQEAGTINITEIHGNRLKLRCIQCNTRFSSDEFPIVEIPPRCPECTGLVKSDTVMFGEPIPQDALSECYAQTYRCDCMLLIGTSAVVYPAAEFPIIARRRGARLIEVNPLETSLSDACDVVLRGPAGEVMPRLVTQVRRLAAERQR